MNRPLLLVVAGGVAWLHAAQAGPPNAEEVAAIDELVVLVRQFRREQDCTRDINYNNQLAAVAQSHTEDMVNRGYFNHVNPEGADAATRLHNAGVWVSLALSVEGLLANLHPSS